MYKYLFSILIIGLVSCGRSQEENIRIAKDIGKKHAENYCSCESKAAADMVASGCYMEHKLAFEKELDKEGFDDETRKEGEQAFKLIKEECDLKR